MVADEASLLETIPKMAPDLVVVDLSLPATGGCNIMRHVSSRHPGLKVIVLSVHDEPAAVAASLAAGWPVSCSRGRRRPTWSRQSRRSWKEDVHLAGHAPAA